MKRLLGMLIIFLSTGIALCQTGPDSLLQFGRQAYQSGDYDAAIAYYREYLRLAEGRKDLPGSANALRLIGDAFRASGELQMAVDQLQEGLSKAQEANDSMIVGRIYDRLAAVYFEMPDPQQAREFCTLSLGIAEALDDLPTISSTLNILGATYRALGQPSLALDALSRSGAIQRSMGDTTDLPNVLNNIANTLISIGKFEAAIDTAKQSYAMATSLKIPVYQQYAAHMAFKGYFELQEYKEAIGWLEIYNGLTNRMMEEARGQEISKMREQMAASQQEQENERLMIENSLQQTTITGRNRLAFALACIGFLTIIIAIGLFLVTRRQRRVNADLQQKNQRIEQQTSQISLINVELAQAVQAGELQNARLKEINKVKDKLFSIISHDLRSPLNSIQGMLQLMEQRLLSEAQATKMAATLKTRVDNTTILLDNLLNWSRSQMEGFAVQPEPLDIADMVGIEINHLDAAAKTKDLVLKNEVQPGAIAHGDRNMVELVLRNLISNAIKFTEAGGRVRVHARAEGGQLHVAVEDTGVGLSAALVDQLNGDNYFTTPGTANEKGSGIGLRLCREFLSKNNGQLWVIQNPHQGTTVWFSIPRA